MSANPWHRRYHSDALAGMLSLTLEERGAYQTVLDLIYDRGGPIADNERLLAGYMNCSIRKWRSLRAALIGQGKLIANGDTLTNPRAERQLENDAKTARKLAENGAKGGRKKAENAKNTNENNDSELAGLDGGFSLPEARSQSIPLDKSNGQHSPPIDPVKLMFDSGVSLITDVGKSEAQARSWLAKARKDFGTEAVITAIGAAKREGAIDPISFMQASLQVRGRPEPVVGI